MQRRAQCLVDQQTRLSIKWGRGQWQVGLFSTNAVCSSEIYETLLITKGLFISLCTIFLFFWGGGRTGGTLDNSQIP